MTLGIINFLPFDPPVSGYTLMGVDKHEFIYDRNEKWSVSIRRNL